MRLFPCATLLLASPLTTVNAECPFGHHLRRAAAQQPEGAPLPSYIFHGNKLSAADAAAYRQAAEALDWNAVKEDIKATLSTSQESWPADFGNYGPLMIRLAWHCAGTYRMYDGLGGCDGARQRFDPERSWPDNTNLDKARKLLVPIKEKYGLGLSWGDLIILTGNTAIESMGGPVLGFCAGRMDDVDGSDSELLGPTAEQELHFPCPVNGQCEAPLGANTVGLIYVNPEGPMGEPVPEQSAVGIRDVFGRMAMNDSETVALIGGGHAFGKTHGACPAGAGPSPKEQEDNPWPGKCGTGKGADAFTSGFEGSWTPTPTKWSNTYFNELLDNTWDKHIGPGGHYQWFSKDLDDEVMMLTTDVALLHDPKGEYKKIVEKYASDQAALDTAFSHAWYKLTTRDMGPVSRCIGPFVPPAQPFQNPLPAPPAKLADVEEVKTAIKKVMTTEAKAILPADTAKDGQSADYSAVFTNLAWQCASTFRSSDYQGGCNGARIRFAPEKDWTKNAGTTEVIQLLEPVKKQFGETLSWSDLIVLAGNVGLEESSGGKAIPFCPGRTDAVDGAGSGALQYYEEFTANAWDWRWKAKMLGVTNREFVALAAMPRSPKQMERVGYKGTWATTPGSFLSNEYFSTLLNEQWEEVAVGKNTQYKAAGKEVYMIPADLLLKNDAELNVIAKEYAADNEVFVNDFVTAWNKVMIADRFDGPNANVCSASVEVPAIAN